MKMKILTLVSGIHTQKEVIYLISEFEEIYSSATLKDKWLKAIKCNLNISF
jgi:hypothetical protein